MVSQGLASPLAALQRLSVQALPRELRTPTCAEEGLGACVAAGGARRLLSAGHRHHLAWWRSVAADGSGYSATPSLGAWLPPGLSGVCGDQADIP